VTPRRCLLFVPGHRPERYTKAITADPDMVCIDLEDAVGPADKHAARRGALDFLAAAPDCRSALGLRCNSLDEPEGQADLDALAGSEAEPAFLMLPKVESSDVLRRADAALGNRATRLIAQIESPRGLLDARDIAAATTRLQGLMFGGFDYAVALRGQPGWDSFFLPRCQLALLAAERGLDFLDVPFLDFHDLRGLAAETDRVIALGATGKAAIHPAQVATIQSCYLPTAEQLERARRVIGAMAAAEGAAVQVDGKLVDRPIALAAERVVALGRLGTRPAPASPPGDTVSPTPPATSH